MGILDIFRNKNSGKQKQLDESIRSLSRLPEEDPNLIIRVNKDGEILYKNHATSDFLKKQSIPEKDILGILPKNIPSLLSSSLKSKKKLSDVEVKIGEYVYSCTLVPISEHGYINIYCTDITERKKADDKILSQNRFLSSIIDSFTNPFCVIDANTYKIVMANSAAKLGGLGEESYCYSLSHKSNKPCSGEHPCPLEEIKKTKKPTVLEHIHYDEKGNQRNIEVHGYPIFDDKGEIVQMIEHSVDITERRKTEKEQLDRVERFALHQEAIVALSAHVVALSNDFESAAKIICETALTALNIERAGVWLLSEDNEQLNCIDIFEIISNKHSKEKSLSPEKYPNFFSALSKEKVIKSDNALEDPRTGELAEDYLIPLKIKSMLDAPIQVRGKVVGVVCHESIDKMRKWHSDEVYFAEAVADQAALALMNIERRKIESQVRGDEKKFKSIIEHSDDMFYIYNTNYEITYCSPQCMDILRYSPSEMMRDWRELWTENPINKEGASLADKALATVEKQKQYVIEIKRKDGPAIFVEVDEAPYKDDDGKLLGIVGAIRNITEQKENEFMIRNAIKEWDNTFNSISDFVFIMDTNNTILKVNKAMADALKIGAEGIAGKQCFEALPNSGHPWVNCPYELTKQDSKPHTEEVFDPAIGVYLLVTTSPIFGEKGELIGTIHIAKDITQSKKTEQEMKKRAEELERFNKLAVGRELRMVELKKRIKELEEKQGDGK